MKFWYLWDLPRLSREKAAIEAIAAGEDWFELHRWGFFGANFGVAGIITAHGARYPIWLLYPDQFPQVPAWVEPQGDERWSSHQYAQSGVLCLELRPDNWTPAATGADVLRSAHNLLGHENPRGNEGEKTSVPSAHHVGEIHSYVWNANPVLLSAGCHDRIKSGAAQHLRALQWIAQDKVAPILVHDAQDRDSPRPPPGADVKSWRLDVSVHVSANTAPADLGTRRSLLEAGGFDAAVIEQLGDKSVAVVIFAGGPELQVYLLLQEGEPFIQKVYVLSERGGERSGRTPAAEGKRVAVIGAGSVGSKIAESLVRAGVRRFTLVDGDVMLPENLERHVLDWRDVGIRKADALKQRLLQIAPGADIQVVTQNLNWQRSARTHAWQVDQVAGCDLIVDATGDVPTALFLGAIAAANHRPFVSVTVYEGGIGALVVSCVPDRDPPYVAARQAYLVWCEQQGVRPPQASSRPYEAVGDKGAPMVADDAAVTMAAGHGARVILDLLDGNVPGPESAWLLVGFRRAWIFEGHGHTLRMSVGEPVPPAAPTQQDGEMAAFIQPLIEEFLREAQTGQRAG